MEDLTNEYIMIRLGLTGNDSLDNVRLKGFNGFRPNGEPRFIKDLNLDAAQTIKTSLVWDDLMYQNDYMLDGDGVKIALWEERIPYLDHNEFRALLGFLWVKF